MKKQLLSEIALYHGDIKMPKGFEIRKDILVKNISLSQLYVDVPYPFSKEIDKMSTYVKEYMTLTHKYRLVDLNVWGNYYERNQTTKPLLELDKQDLKNSADFVCLYGVQIDEDTCKVHINYDDNRRTGKTWSIDLTTNKYLIFPTSQTYYIDNINNNSLNYIQTITYTYM